MKKIKSWQWIWIVFIGVNLAILAMYYEMSFHGTFAYHPGLLMTFLLLYEWVDIIIPLWLMSVFHTFVQRHMIQTLGGLIWKDTLKRNRTLMTILYVVNFNCINSAGRKNGIADYCLIAWIATILLEMKKPSFYIPKWRRIIIFAVIMAMELVVLWKARDITVFVMNFFYHLTS